MLTFIFFFSKSFFSSYFSNSLVLDQVSITGRGIEEKLSAKRDKSHILFGGTKILQHTPDKVTKV